MLVVALALLPLATAQTSYENRRKKKAVVNSGLTARDTARIPERDEEMCSPTDPLMRGEKSGCCRRYRKINGKGCPEFYGDCNSHKDCGDETWINSKGKKERKYFCIRGVGFVFGYQNEKVDVCLSKQERENTLKKFPDRFRDKLDPTPLPTPAPTNAPIDSFGKIELNTPAPTPYPVIRVNNGLSSPTPEPTYHDADETPTPTYAAKKCQNIIKHQPFRYMVIECVRRPDCYYQFDTMTTGRCLDSKRTKKTAGLQGLEGPTQHCATCKEIEKDTQLEAKYRAQLCIARADCELVQGSNPRGTKSFISVDFDINWTCHERVDSSVPACE